jgi:predicted MFS family arabinose efflux permease
VQDELKVKNSKPVYSNKLFMILFFAMLVFAVAFFQYFSAMPIYYKDIHILTEPEIGLLLGGNGLIIFLLEMPVISWLENKKYNKVSLIILGSFLTGLSFLVLNLTTWSGVLIIGMFLMTIGEMIAFPFANSYAMDLSKGENQGEYMAMYVMSFSIASVFGFNAGFQTIEAYGYNKTWSTMCILLILCIILLFYLKTLKKKQHLI